MNKLEQFNFLLDNIEKRPQMIVGVKEFTYHNCVCFFQGVATGLIYGSDQDLERAISQWYQEKVDFKAPNMNWFMQFEHVNSDLSDRAKIRELVSTIKKFFQENSNFFEPA